MYPLVNNHNVRPPVDSVQLVNVTTISLGSMVGKAAEVDGDINQPITFGGPTV